MKTRNAIFSAIGLTLGWVLTGGYWALGPFRYWPIEIFGEHDDVVLIRSLFPIRIVDPNWVHASKDDFAVMWCIAEYKARAAIVLVSWLALLIAFIFWVRRTRSAINSAQPSATRSAADGG